MLNLIAKVAVGTITYFIVSLAFVYAFYDKIMAWTMHEALKMLDVTEDN